MEEEVITTSFVKRLVKEIEELKKINEEHRKINGELRDRINKAIETIKDEGLVVAIKITNGEEETLLSSKELLLDILKGEKNVRLSSNE